ncbi:Similar to AQP11: Aquaporin-11 (Milnesium tardigradum) [Cotesia congregata]|uniref:Aquaporin n=1 Tax=Cotesia congregata TaxID=51543 RepID=A0A8J2MJD5_COTCN|nr:Similar to AQP11: Aquaporin-11 (Milnesium tardigradum) [Cotesia congregata]
MGASLIALFVSTVYIVLTSWLAFWARKYAKFYTQRPFLRALFLEGIATAELCGACFELIIIADNWGVSMYAIYLFVLTIWWSKVWEDATACPYTHLEELVEGKKSLRDAFLLIWAELVGGLAIFRYIQLLWALEIVSTHKNRAFDDCSTDLQVPVIFGAIVECIATCICRVVSRGLSELDSKLGTVIDAFIGTTLVVAAFNYSGGYFNPALATSLKYGCLGTTFMEHVIVYWVGACAGSILSIRVYQHPAIQSFVQKHKPKSH